MDTSDFSKISDADLLKSIHEGLAVTLPKDTPAPSHPEAPAFSFDDVMKGMARTEVTRASSDTAFAQTVFDRHADFSRRTAAGENPVDPDTAGDFGLWQWQQRVADKPGFWSTVAQVVGETGKSFVELGKELPMIAAAGQGNPIAQRSAADLAAVSGAKAVAMNNLLVRGVAGWGERFLNGAKKLFGDLTPEQRDALDEQYQRHAFEAARTNAAEADTAKNFHRHAANLIEGLAKVGVGQSEVNQSAADLLSMVPQMVAEGGVSIALSRAGVSTAVGAFSSAAEKLALKRTELAAARTALDGAVATAGTAGSGEVIADALTHVKTLEADISGRASKMAELANKAEAESVALTEPGRARAAVAGVISGAGKAASWAGGKLERLQNLPDELAARIAPESEQAQKLIATSTRSLAAGAAGYAVDDERGGAVGGLLGLGAGRVVSRGLQAGGTDVARLGELYSHGEATLPFFRRVRMARDTSGLTKQAAAFLDNSTIAAGVHLAAGAAKGAAGAGALGAGLGAVMSPDDVATGVASGLGSGAIFGLGVGGLAQWRTYADAGQVRIERAGQLRTYKDLLAARPDEARIFEKLPANQQEHIAHYLAALPDLKVNYIDDASRPPGQYDPRALPDEITVNVASKDPLRDIAGHEIAHFVAEHELGDFITKRAIGDADAGIPGDYTARDANWNPVREVTADGKVGAYKVNAEFAALAQRYVDALKKTAETRNWPQARTDEAVARVSDPAYVAHEVFAEQFLNYLNSDSYVRDLKGHHSVSDVVNNTPFLKQALGRLGVVFGAGGEVHSSLLGTFSKSKTFDGLMREYTRKQAQARLGDTEFTGGDTKVDESALTKATGYAERYFDASGELARDPAGNAIYGPDGKATLRSARAAAADSREATKVATAALDALAKAGTAQDPGTVQRRTTVDGRTVYSGRYLPDEAVAAIEASGRFNPTQLDNLKQINGELKTGLGREWNHFYQAATKKDGGSRYRSLAGRWRTDLGYGFLISAQDNILVQSVSLEVLAENAARSVAKGEAKLWNNSVGELLKDSRTYLENLAGNKPGETGLSVDKKNFLNNLLGLRVKAHGDVNPLFEVTNRPKTVVTSLRLDRMNRVSPVSERNVPFSTASYQRAAKNLRPDAPAPGLLGNRGAAESGLSDLRPDVPDVTTGRRLPSEDPLHFRPDANDETQRVARGYVEHAFGAVYEPHAGYDAAPESKRRAIADHYNDVAKHDPADPEVQKSYQALAAETRAQYDAMTKAGITIEPFTGKGEPYASSEEMMKDVRDNKHLSFFLTDSGFGDGTAAKDNPLLQPSGVKIGDRELLNNDLFRAVHDYFGHTQQGFAFGPRGEFNAWKSHSRMFSDDAQGALAAETLAQNAWVNFGPHLRDAAGKIAAKGEPGYVAPKDRPFAEQKNFVVPAELRSQLRPDAKDDLGFHPQLETTLSAIPEKATRQQIEAALRDGVKEKGQIVARPIRQEELADTRDSAGTSFGEWMKQNPTATREQMLDFARENRVQVLEHVMGDALAPEELTREKFLNVERNRRQLTDGENDELLRFEKFREEGTAGPTKYHNYQLPGGTNYREAVLTIPHEPDPQAEQRRAQFKSDRQNWHDEKTARQADVGVAIARLQFEYGVANPFDLPFGSSEGATKEKNPAKRALWQTLDAARAAEDEVWAREPRAPKNDGGYKSSHFTDVPNYLAHVRHNTRTTADGSPVLFAEELQSDLHQQGRKSGYATAATPEKLAELDAAVATANSALHDRAVAIRKENGLPETFGEILAASGDVRIKYKDLKANDAEYQRLFDEVSAADARARDARAAKGVPDAPFKKSWHELAFKYLLNKAVEAGADHLAWTTGEQQAARYDLSKQISSIELKPYSAEKQYLAAYDKSGYRVIDKMVTPDEIPDIIGKEAAAKLEAKEWQTRPAQVGNPGDLDKVKQLRGLELQVGGEGMKGFYDRILPQFADKYLKRFGVKTEDITVGTADDPKNPRPGEVDLTVHAVKITDAMRQEIKDRGQPQYRPDAVNTNPDIPESRESVTPNPVDASLLAGQLSHDDGQGTGEAEGQVSRRAERFHAARHLDAGVRFHSAVTAAYRAHPRGAAGTVLDASVYAAPGTQLFLSADKSAGAAVTADGSLVSVFRHPGSSVDIASILTPAAAQATKLTAFAGNGFLPNLYARFGFRPVARVAFDPALAPAGWPEKMGRPDVVFMVNDPHGRSGAVKIEPDYRDVVDRVPVVDFSEAERLQAEGVAAVR